jgi:hypothetical protein
MFMKTAFAKILCATSLAAVGLSASAQTVTTIATDLNGPRGLKFGPDGALYVAEAGTGGPNGPFNCEQVPVPVGPYHGGPTARISKITGINQRVTVVDGLPSGKSSLPSGDTVGVADVAFVGDTLFALLAGGGCSHGNLATPNGVIKIDVDHGTWSYVADLSAFEMATPIANPTPSLDDWEPDGTWYGMVAVRGQLYATEPNHQRLFAFLRQQARSSALRTFQEVVSPGSDLPRSPTRATSSSATWRLSLLIRGVRMFSK